MFESCRAHQSFPSKDLVHNTHWRRFRKEPLSTTALSVLFERFVEEKRLRHTFATSYLQNGGEVVRLSRVWAIRRSPLRCATCT